jgi:hypothetical protein
MFPKILHGRIFQTVLSRLSEAEQALLERLLDKNTSGYFTEFNCLREAPKSATLTHLDEWVDRLTWLLSLGNMERLVEGLPPTKVIHFAAEAHSLHADDLRDFTFPKPTNCATRLWKRLSLSEWAKAVQSWMPLLSPRIAQRDYRRANPDPMGESHSEPTVEPVRDGKPSEMKSKTGRRQEGVRNSQEKRAEGLTRRRKLVREEGTQQLSRLC